MRTTVIHHRSSRNFFRQLRDRNIFCFSIPHCVHGIPYCFDSFHNGLCTWVNEVSLLIHCVYGGSKFLSLHIIHRAYHDMMYNMMYAHNIYVTQFFIDYIYHVSPIIALYRKGAILYRRVFDRF